MPRVFAITTPAPEISLDPSGRGEVSFTVSNSTDTPMRVRASLLPSAFLKREWLSLRGPTVRDLPAGSTEVFIVDIQVPPGTPPGRYTFRLVAADNDLPDERFAEGPTVSVAMSAPAAAPARGVPWWLIALGVVVIAGGGVAAFFALRDGESECPAGQTSCAGECVDLQADTQNCGSCGTSCGLDQICQAGVCQCTQGLARCGDACVSLQTSDENCGSCGNRCGENFDCREGQCVRTSCSGGQTLCGDQCVDTRTDERNCGRCGRRCGANQVCQAGSCQCTSGLVLCGGTCVNLKTSDKNCGRCGVSCPSGFECRGGQCVRTDFPECKAGQVLCPCTQTCMPPALCAKRCEEDRQPL